MFLLVAIGVAGKGSPSAPMRSPSSRLSVSELDPELPLPPMCVPLVEAPRAIAASTEDLLRSVAAAGDIGCRS